MKRLIKTEESMVQESEAGQIDSPDFQAQYDVQHTLGDAEREASALQKMVKQSVFFPVIHRKQRKDSAPESVLSWILLTGILSKDTSWMKL